jgi:hypothetical protein
MTQREREAAEQALEFLTRQPPSVSLAIGCLKAALDPDAPRWDDDLRVRGA